MIKINYISIKQQGQFKASQRIVDTTGANLNLRDLRQSNNNRVLNRNKLSGLRIITAQNAILRRSAPGLTRPADIQNPMCGFYRRNQFFNSGFAGFTELFKDTAKIAEL
ncbi:MAG: hypothetical protein ACD_39C00112G0001 [uncultured bacterium]|nr:MAG: hypothetical protein ACD_39C00112G0001 [uncultured bacterium]